MTTHILTRQPSVGCAQHGLQARRHRPRTLLQPMSAVAGLRVAQADAPAAKPAQDWEVTRTTARSAAAQQRAPVQQQMPPPQAADYQQLDALDELGAWAARFRRQVQGLPNGGEAALVRMLHAVHQLLAKTDNTASHKLVLRSYIMLGLIDMVAQAWQQRLDELQSQQQAPPQQALTSARLALSGCRYLRLEAAGELGRRLHLLLDQQGYSPTLDLSRLPAPHALGLRVPQLLARGLGLDLASPAYWGHVGAAAAAPSSSATTTASQDPHLTASLANLTWDEYEAASADASMCCGDWAFCYWQGDATWVPAPFGKFATGALVALLTPATILASLPNGIWGRALVNVTSEFGLSYDPSQLKQQAQAQARQAAQQQHQQRGGAANSAVRVPEAVKQLLEGGMMLELPARNVRARARQFSAAFAQARAAVRGGAVAAAGGAPASMQAN